MMKFNELLIKLISYESHIPVTRWIDVGEKYRQLIDSLFAWHALLLWESQDFKYYGDFVSGAAFNIGSRKLSRLTLIILQGEYDAI